MVKKETQNLDVDFIKEYEELKIKQKLLIESLQKRALTQESELFMDVNSKLDFLVKVFKDSMKEDEEEQENQKSFEEDVLAKIDILIEKVDKNKEEFDEKLKNLVNKSVVQNDGAPKIEVPPLSTDKVEGAEENKVEGKKVDDVVKKEDKGAMPPPPNFTAKLDDKKPEVKVDEVKIADAVENTDKKKKWF